MMILSLYLSYTNTFVSNTLVRFIYVRENDGSSEDYSKDIDLIFFQNRCRCSIRDERFRKDLLIYLQNRILEENLIMNV